MWARWKLTSNAADTRATIWSSTPRAASPACPPAVRATVSTEASASTCPMGPAAGGRGWGQEAEGSAGNPSCKGSGNAMVPRGVWKFRMAPFVIKRKGIRGKRDNGKEDVCMPKLCGWKSCYITYATQTSYWVDIMTTLKMRKLQLRDDKESA